MRLCVTSDTHGRNLPTPPPADIFIHCGDFTSHGTLTDVHHFACWLLTLDYEHILLVPGNHDTCFEKASYLMAASLFDHRVSVLVDRGVTIDGVSFWGSPWTPPFCNWSFMAPEPRLRRLYRSMPMDLDVLLTHGPPYGILDPGHDSPHVGSRELNLAVLRRRIRHHCFGHLHAAGGQSMHFAGTEFHNVAACNEAYQIANSPALIDL